MRKTTKHLIATLSVVIALVIVLSMSLIACDHTHNYSEQGKDENYHWNYCPDDEEIDETSKEAHKDENSDGKCDVCGYDGMHVHDYTAQGKDSSQHWNYCPTDNAVDQSSKSSHVDSDVNGYCDVCGYEMGIVSEEVVKIELVEGVPTLIVKGNLPEVSQDGEPVEIGCVKLHAVGNDNHLYWDNLCSHKWGYEFQVALTDLSKEGTPWWYFHVYPYLTEPAEDAKGTPLREINLPLGTIQYNDYYDYEEVRYNVIRPDWDGQLIIQPKDVPSFAVSEVSVDTTDGLKLIVKGTVSNNQKCLVIRAEGNDNDEWFGEKATINANNFEAEFDLTQLKSDGTPWCKFHVYTYTEENPADYNEGKQKSDLPLGGLEYGAHFDYNGIRYNVINPDWEGQLVIQPKEYISATINIDAENGVLIVSGDIPTKYAEYPIIKLHAWQDGAGDLCSEVNSSAEAGKFELRFDITQLKTENTPWAWFHFWFCNAEGEKVVEINMNRPDSVPAGYSVDYNGVRYTVQNNDQFVLNADIIAE